MARPSLLQPVGGPLAGLRFEFRGGDVIIGRSPECAVRIDAPGVEDRHAQIVIDVTGATIIRVDGIVGVNDDVVMGDSLLRSGDFVWLGEPGGANSIMLQFTLGDVEETPAAVVRVIAPPVEEAMLEEVVSEDLGAGYPEAPLEAPAHSLAVDAPEEAGMMEMAAEPIEEAHVEESHFEAAYMGEAHAEEVHVEEAEVHEEVQIASIEEAMLEEPHIDEAHLVAEPADFAALEAGPMELEPHLESHEELMEAPAELPANPSVKTIPPAPWLTPSSSESSAAPTSDYASSWESPAPAAAPPSPPAEPATPPPVRPTPPAPKPIPAAGPAAAKRPTPSSPIARPKAKAAEPVAAPPRPPARTTSSAPMIVGGLVALLVLGGGALLFLGPAEEPAPAPTPAPTPVVAAPTPEPVAPTPPPDAAQVAAVEPTPAPTPQATPTAPPVTTPRPGAAPTPRTTPTPRATPTPAPTRPGAPATPTPAPAVAAPAAPVSPVPRLLEEARAAMTARDFPKAQQALDQVLRLEPGNAEATTRKAEVASRLAVASKKFAVGATNVIGGKSAKGPTGFDLGGAAAVKTDFSAQIRCTTNPAAVEEGTLYTVRCVLVNTGTKSFKLESVAANETRDGAKTPGSGTSPRGDLAPQSETAILQKTGAWAAKASWSLEIVAKTNKDESFRAVYNWR